MKIQVYALLTDNGDGGWTVRLFPSHQMMEEFRKDLAYGGKKYDANDEYEFGYPSFENPITIEVDEKGSLVKDYIPFGFGQ